MIPTKLLDNHKFVAFLSGGIGLLIGVIGFVSYMAVYCMTWEDMWAIPPPQAGC